MNKVKLSKLNSSLQGEYDVFMCCSSFETRCTSVPQKLQKKKFKKVLVFKNKYGSNSIQEHATILADLFPTTAKVLDMDLEDPLGIADTISYEIGKGFANKRISVLIDISTFTHEALMICLRILSLKKNITSITCTYVNASDYCPDLPADKKWLSRGCKNLHSVLGYSGVLLPSQKNRLIVIVGYEHHRAADIISLFEPNALTLVYGSPENSTTEKNKDANKLYVELVQDMSFEYSDVERREIPCNDPDQTAIILEQIYESHPDENLIVIPMNNKLSTVGVVKSLLNNQAVQACYAPAVVYNEDNYSLPGNDCYIYEF